MFYDSIFRFSRKNEFLQQNPPEPPGDVWQRLLEKIEAIASRIRAPMPPGER
jgi:hypothetical protein